jgi:transposase
VNVMPRAFCGLDWAEGHHDLALVDQDGKLIAKRRITDNAEGFAEMLELLAEAGDRAENPIPVAIETSRGLMVAALRATGRAIYAINPMAVARYRERHSVSRTKSDHVDAMTLANILRTDAHMHRTLPADSVLVRAIAVLARAAQDAVWRRTKATQELRSLLREYYPGFLAAFAQGTVTNLASPQARAVLALAPTPAAGARLSTARIVAALRRAGRQRGIDALAIQIQQALRTDQLRHPELVENAMGRQTIALLATLTAECVNAEELGQAAIETFRQHPDYAIITSFPGLGEATGARVLAEIGDDRTRFADARGLKAFAGSAPVTRASGRSISITRRTVKNNRLAAVGFIWAFAAIPRPSPTRNHYHRRRDHGDKHAAALRHLFNRMLGQLHHCLQTGQTYNPTKAFPEPLEAPEQPAA